MAADIRQVMRILDYRGIDVRLEGARLIARPRHGALPDDMRSFIRHFRDRIVAFLQERERLAETVANIIALSPEEREEYRWELAAADDDRPDIDHDREAWRIACAAMEPLEGAA